MMKNFLFCDNNLDISHGSDTINFIRCSAVCFYSIHISNFLFIEIRFGAVKNFQQEKSIGSSIQFQSKKMRRE